jgi:SAM-dependent methyltransferase
MTSESAGLNPIESSNSTPSGNKYLRRVLKDLNISTQNNILDLGCGKGSAMRLMREFPFSKITGVELSSKVAKIAELNFERLKCTRCEIICDDARNFKDFASYSHFYLYNPFPKEVMDVVISNLVGSLSVGGEATLIYCNPVCHDVVMRTGLFNKVADYPADWSNRIYVYKLNRDNFSKG